MFGGEAQQQRRQLADRLVRSVERQVAAIAPITDDREFTIDPRMIIWALERTCFCVDRVIMWSKASFDPLNAMQYSIFLYWLSRKLYIEGAEQDAAKVFFLNKALSGMDLFYEIEMPDLFMINHTVGAVFVKAQYGERAVFHQGCTVGRILDKRPVIEDDLVMYSGSAIIGQCHVRKNTIISAGVFLINRDTPGDCLVFADGKDYVFKPIDEIFSLRYFSH